MVPDGSKHAAVFSPLRNKPTHSQRAERGAVISVRSFRLEPLWAQQRDCGRDNAATDTAVTPGERTASVSGMEPFKASYTKSADAANAPMSPSVPANAVRIHKILYAYVQSSGEVRCVGRNMVHVACDVIRPTKEGKRGGNRHPHIVPHPKSLKLSKQSRLRRISCRCRAIAL